MTTPTVPLHHCEFDVKRKVLKLASEFCGMPSELIIHSHHTGNDVRFRVVGPADELTVNYIEGDVGPGDPMDRYPAPRGIIGIKVYHKQERK